ncbi:MAG: hypothetical protein H6713_24685 [Myxococcales bacterium]|nr:hypothetical protein [Myxococcales bacterium]
MTRLRAPTPRQSAAHLFKPLGAIALVLPIVGLMGCEGPHKDLAECAISSPNCGGSDGDTDLTAGTTSGSSMSDTSGGPGGSNPSDPSDPSDPSGGSSGTNWPDPVPCDGPPDCTDQSGGDLGPVTMPFFRGQVCVPSTVGAGDAVPVRLTACTHPCLAVNAYAFKHMFRCDLNNDPACELAANVRYPGVTGQSCPDDVFGKFDDSYCDDYGPLDIMVGPVSLGGEPYEGTASLLIPFLTNDDAGAIEGGNNSADAVWGMIEQYEQPADRSVTITFSAGAQTPADCSQDGACDCYSVGY